LRLAEDRELRTRLGMRGRELFCEQFRHEHMTGQLRSLYARLLARAPR
jgi:glycosyltransferase involved in cell wall biosynthesis